MGELRRTEKQTFEEALLLSHSTRFLPIAKAGRRTEFLGASRPFSDLQSAISSGGSQPTGETVVSQHLPTDRPTDRPTDQQGIPLTGVFRT